MDDDTEDRDVRSSRHRGGCSLTRPFSRGIIDHRGHNRAKFPRNRHQIFDEHEINCSSRTVPLCRVGRGIKCQGRGLLHAYEILSSHLEPRALDKVHMKYNENVGCGCILGAISHEHVITRSRGREGSKNMARGKSLATPSRRFGTLVIKRP